MAKEKPKKQVKPQKGGPSRLTATRFSVKSTLAALDGPTTVLGNSRAVTIVCHCAGTVLGNLPRTLGELGVSGLPFRRCVALSVRNAGFAVDPATIPAGPDNTLIDVVNAIHNLPPV